MPHCDVLLTNAHLATLCDTGDDYGAIRDGALAIRDGTLVYVGPAADCPTFDADRRIDLGGAWVTPALIDAHTHLVFGGNRAREFEQRLSGLSYADIAKAGGGILSTVRATRAASVDELVDMALPRALALRADGVARIEIKSGYALDLDGERRMLQAARRIGEISGQAVHTSFLGLHAVPPEYREDRAGYVRAVTTQWLPALAAEGLVDAVDAFCESIAFTPDETRELFEAAERLGLPVKLHADQLTNLGGAALTAGFRGLSADHLEYTDAHGVEAMAEAGTVAMLLPAAFYALKETQRPPIDDFRRCGVPMAVATDCNPGTSPLLSLRTAMNQACVLFGLTPEEALAGATVHAARALGVQARTGTLEEGKLADLAVWRVSEPAELAYWMGGGLLRSLWREGRELG